MLLLEREKFRDLKLFQRKGEKDESSGSGRVEMCDNLS